MASRLLQNDPTLGRSRSKIMTSSARAPDDSHPSPNDFGPYISWVYNVYYALTDRVIVKNIIVEEPSQKLKVRSNLKSSTITKHEESKQNFFNSTSTQADEESINGILDGIRIIASYDKANNLIQLDFLKEHKIIPQALLKILALIIQFYPYLQKITAKGVLHSFFIKELCNILHFSNVTSVNLDDTYSHAFDYNILLTTAGNLRELSLARCSLNDDAVKAISDEITFPKPAAMSLSQLNLSGNLITSIGVQYIANALRTNRKLYYLNLSGNYISDEGVLLIFDVLQKFPLTFEEDYNKRQRYYEHLRRVNELREDFARKIKDDMSRKLLEQHKNKSKLGVQKSHPRPELRKGKELDMEFTALGAMAFDDPLRAEETYLKGNTVYCYGNNTLCYLNLAYNHLTFLTVKKLLQLLKIQASAGRKPLGLVKVRLEGNILPMTCQELMEIENIFDAQLKPLTQKGRRLK